MVGNVYSTNGQWPQMSQQKTQHKGTPTAEGSLDKRNFEETVIARDWKRFPLNENTVHDYTFLKMDWNKNENILLIDPSVHWFVWLLSFPVLIISPTKQRANSSADTESKELWPWAWQSPKLYQLLFIFCSLSVLNHCSSKYNSWLIELSKNSPLFFKTQFCYYYH